MQYYLQTLNDGHVGILDPYEYRAYLDIKPIMKMPYFNKILNNNEVKEKYVYWSNLLGHTPNIDLLFENVNKEAEQNVANKNISVKIINENIAYMKINSFSTFKQEDINTISDFYKNLNSYKDFIVDIRGNGGGDSYQWMNYIVSPIIDKYYSWTSYSLHKGGSLTKEYYKSRGTLSDLEPIYEFPQEEFLHNIKGIEQFKYFEETEYGVSPYDNKLKYKPKVFKGNIYLFVDKGVFSSAESLTLFAKNSGWATVAGSNTGGDGIGIDPVLLKLPNSKLLVRFTTQKGLNKDGSNNSETGTTPDVKIDELDNLVNYINTQYK
ncbi:S41 family peptidase [Romboutsia sp.]|uniref:S41 family peptidase n=1 Tax=Romboutsia sp. TaxID=1965302 RepID=UPI003F2AD5F0